MNCSVSNSFFCSVCDCTGTLSAIVCRCLWLTTVFSVRITVTVLWVTSGLVLSLVWGYFKANTVPKNIFDNHLVVLLVWSKCHIRSMIPSIDHSKAATEICEFVIRIYSFICFLHILPTLFCNMFTKFVNSMENLFRKSTTNIFMKWGNPVKFRHTNVNVLQSK